MRRANRRRQVDHPLNEFGELQGRLLFQVQRESNEAGQYLFDFVSPGAYTLNVEMAGFRSFIQENILVQTRSDVTVNARLEVGQLTETIRVTEAPVTVQFNKTTMETTIDTKMSNSLPII